MNESEKISSTEQDSWIEMAAAIRRSIESQIPLIPAMKIEEQKQFVEAVQHLYWLEMNAHIWDKKIDLENAKLFADQ